MFKNGWFISSFDFCLFYFFLVFDESKVYLLVGYRSGKIFFVVDFIFFFLEIIGCVWVVVGVCFYLLVIERFVN